MSQVCHTEKFSFPEMPGSSRRLTPRRPRDPPVDPARALRTRSLGSRRPPEVRFDDEPEAASAPAGPAARGSALGPARGRATGVRRARSRGSAPSRVTAGRTGPVGPAGTPGTGRRHRARPPCPVCPGARRCASFVPPRAIGAAVARFVHTEEVTGSNPVSPTRPSRRRCADAPPGRPSDRSSIHHARRALRAARLRAPRPARSGRTWGKALRPRPEQKILLFASSPAAHRTETHRRVT